MEVFHSLPIGSSFVTPAALWSLLALNTSRDSCSSKTKICIVFANSATGYDNAWYTLHITLGNLGLNLRAYKLQKFQRARVWSAV